jgi:predicted nucleic acid-binding protein
VIVVSNSTPLISLARINRLHLLEEIFGKVYIPQGVYEEVVMEGVDKAGAKEVSEGHWIEVVEVHDRLSVEVLSDELDKGESEAIVLAKELKANWVLMDERLARRKLETLGVNKIGTLGILLRAKEAGMIKAIRPEMDRLTEQGFRISRRVYWKMLQMAGET